MTEAKEMTIGELARRVGLKTSALRYYEERGLLAPARRVGGRRRYREDALDRLRVIQLAQRSGFTLGEIEVLMADFDEGKPSDAWTSMANAKLLEIDDQLGRLRTMRTLLHEGISCACLDLRVCARAAASKG